MNNFCFVNFLSKWNTYKHLYILFFLFIILNNIHLNTRINNTAWMCDKSEQRRHSDEEKFRFFLPKKGFRSILDDFKTISENMLEKNVFERCLKSFLVEKDTLGQPLSIRAHFFHPKLFKIVWNAFKTDSQVRNLQKYCLFECRFCIWITINTTVISKLTTSKMYSYLWGILEEAKLSHWLAYCTIWCAFSSFKLILNVLS